MLPTQIVIIGAGSASFGLNTLSTLLRSERLQGSRLALVDQNPENLAVMHRLAERLNREWGAGMTVTAHTHHGEALAGAHFVVNALETPPREALWHSDLEIPLKYGVRQPYAENGGPGGFFHAARNIRPVLEIARDMERLCPEAWFINYSNPMMRICDAIARYSRIKVVGLCHQVYAGHYMIAKALAPDLGAERPKGWDNWDQMIQLAHTRLRILAAGLNHFTWVLSIHDQQTGEDLYPLFTRRWAEIEPAFEPLTRRMFAAFNCFPVPGDNHMSEYLPFVSHPVTRPWEKFTIHLFDFDYARKERAERVAQNERMAAGIMDINHLRGLRSEGVLEMIENIAGAGRHYHLAVNIPNQGYIQNLPEGVIVEVPAIISADGVQGVGVGELPEGVAELCRRETAVTRLCVDATVHGDRRLALQGLLLDPVIHDLDLAEQILDDYLVSYREYLPQFWN